MEQNRDSDPSWKPFWQIAVGHIKVWHEGHGVVRIESMNERNIIDLVAQHHSARPGDPASQEHRACLLNDLPKLLTLRKTVEDITVELAKEF